jgi:hypothetical protein
MKKELPAELLKREKTTKRRMAERAGIDQQPGGELPLKTVVETVGGGAC